jgi:diguanylate cyclase (GGDEF)-like protein
LSAISASCCSWRSTGWISTRVDREIGRARRYGRPLSLLLIDIDYFKTINDTYGHPADDRILKTLGDLLRNLFRKTDMTARYGGEEFVVVLPETGPDTAAQLAERFRETVARTRFATEEAYLPLTVSIGLSTLRQENTDGAARKPTCY